MTDDGQIGKGIEVFSSPIGDETFTKKIMKIKAHQVCDVVKDYIVDLQEEHPQELWTMLQYSLHHKVTYWLRTCTPEETKEMAEMVDGDGLEAS